MINIGLVGCGRISKNHFNAINNYKNIFKLVAVCDIIKARADKAAAENSCKAYYSLTEMLKSEKLNLLSICTPSGLHPLQGIKAAKAGINVLTEKPIGVNLQEVNKLINTCKENKVHLFVVKQNRLNPTMQALKKAINQGRFGKIYMAQSNVFWTRPQDYYNQARWRGTWKLDGGIFMNQANHYIDMLHWLFGEAESVTAVTETLARNIETDDTGAAIIKFKSGVIATINVTMLTYPKNFEGSITVLGENGTVKVGGIAINKIEKWEFKNGNNEDREILNASYDTNSVYGFGHTKFYANVANILNTCEADKIDNSSIKKSLELIQAIYLANKEKKTIVLPIKN